MRNPDIGRLESLLFYAEKEVEHLSKVYPKENREPWVAAQIARSQKTAKYCRDCLKYMRNDND